MDLQLSDVITWKDQFGNFFEEIEDAFGRKEVQQQAWQYLHGLLAPVEGKNCWNIAQATHQKHPQSAQRFLRSAHWDEKKSTPIFT